MNLKGWFPLAKPGTFKDAKGIIVEFTKEKLQRIVDRYNPSQFEAALTIGHPAEKDQTAPAYGIVEAVKMVGDTLFFKPGRLVKEFAQAVSEGKFFRVSGGFEVLEENEFTLNHVAFLGAQRPAIDGLGRIQFSSPQEKVSYVDLADVSKEWLGKIEFSSNDNWIGWRLQDIGDALRRLREWLIGKEGNDAADQVVPSWLVDSIKQPLPEPTQVGMASPTPSNQGGSVEFEALYNEEKSKREAAEAKNIDLSTQVTTLTTEVTTLRSENATMKADRQRAEFSAFCEKMITEGKLLPGEKETTIMTMESLSTAGMITLAAGGEKSRLDIYKESITNRPKIVEFAHIATKHGAAANSDDPNTIAVAARSYMAEMAAKGVVVNEIDAVKHVMGK